MLTPNKKRKRWANKQAKNLKKRKLRKNYERIMHVFHRNLNDDDRKAILNGNKLRKERKRHENKHKSKSTKSAK